jgi:hypothetical protein
MWGEGADVQSRHDNIQVLIGPIYFWPVNSTGAPLATHLAITYYLRQNMSPRSTLVSQYLENISRNALKKYQDITKGYVRHRQGIYALYRRDRLYYVGLATDLRWRLKQHLNDHHGQSWDRFSVYLTVGDQHLRDLESLVLRIVKPTGNKVKGKFSRSENFAAPVRERYEPTIPRGAR